MLKKVMGRVGLGGLIVFAVFLGPARGFCDEQVTVTMYYPTPCGVYKEVRANAMTVGSEYRSTADLTDGFLNVKNFVGVKRPPGPAASYGVPSHQASLDVNGYMAVNDIYLKNVGKWAGEADKKVIVGGTWTSDMVLPDQWDRPAVTYTVVVWATYFTPDETSPVCLYCSGQNVACYSGSGGDSPGVDQNMIMTVVTGKGPGVYTWTLDGMATQWCFAWVAFEE